MSKASRAVANSRVESEIESESASEYEPSIADERPWEANPASASESDDDVIVNPESRSPTFVRREWDPSAALAIATQPQDSLAEVEQQIARFDAETSVQDLDTEDSPSDSHVVNQGGNKQSAEFYRQSMRNLDVNNYKRKTYAEGTLAFLKSCQDFWQMFCLEVLCTTDWGAALYHIDFVVVYHFLWWHLNQTKSPSGRRKRPITKSSSLITFWCIFRLLYERSTLEKIDDALPRGVINNALVDLGKKFALDPEKRENRSITIEDLKLQIETLLRTTKIHFKLGEIRILAVLFLLLLAPQGSRPQSILNLRFKDIDVILIRDPENPHGPPRLTLRLRLAMTKTYKGPKAIKTFLVPEIMYDPSLLLSPHVFLLAVLVRNRVFEDEELNDNLDKLAGLKVSGRANQLKLLLKEEWGNRPLFRQSEKALGGYRMSHTKAITQKMTGNWIRTSGQILGFEHHTITYNLRYMAGNNLDQSTSVSRPLRDLILDHAPDSATFQKNYLNRNICADLWAIHRNLTPQQALIRQATSHGGSRDSRRVYKLSDRDLAEIKRNPKYIRMTSMLDSKVYGFRSEQRKALTRERKILFDKLKKEKLDEVVKQWTAKQSREDVQRQLRGEDISQDRDEEIFANTIQERMFQAVTAPLINDFRAQQLRSINAVKCLVAYGNEEEPLETPITRASRQRPPEELNLAPAQALDEIRRSTFVSVVGYRQVRRCFICVAKAFQLGRDHERFDLLCHNHYNEYTLARHFTSVHLDGVQHDDKGECPICADVLVDKNHLRKHADNVHGICTARKRPMRYVPQADGKRQRQA